MVQEIQNNEELLKEEKKKKEKNQILIEDATLASFGIANLSECTVD